MTLASATGDARREAGGGRGLAAEPDDHRLLERGSFVYDALYEWCRYQLHTRANIAS